MAEAIAQKSNSGRANLILTITAVIGLVVIGMFFPTKLGPVEIGASPIASIAGITVSNTWISSWMTIIIWVLLFGLTTRNLRLVPGRIQSLCEMIIETLLGMAMSVAGEKKGRQAFTLFASIFLFVLLNNWQELLPGFTNGTILIKSPLGTMVPLLRSGSADLNTTLALAIVSFIVIQAFSIKYIGLNGWRSRFFNFGEGGIGIFVGLLELISEFAKIISFSFRLFGNMFAGDVLLAVIPFLIPFAVVLPFMALEMFVGLIQAFIFAMLTVAFISMATISHSGHIDEHEEEAAH